MPDGIERRAQIDHETFKALVLLNGSGAVAAQADARPGRRATPDGHLRTSRAVTRQDAATRPLSLGRGP
jgi:hypothetical protein